MSLITALSYNHFIAQSDTQLSLMFLILVLQRYRMTWDYFSDFSWLFTLTLGNTLTIQAWLLWAYLEIKLQYLIVPLYCVHVFNLPAIVSWMLGEGCSHDGAKTAEHSCDDLMGRWVTKILQGESTDIAFSEQLLQVSITLNLVPESPRMGVQWFPGHCCIETVSPLLYTVLYCVSLTSMLLEGEQKTE